MSETENKVIKGNNKESLVEVIEIPRQKMRRKQ